MAVTSLGICSLIHTDLWLTEQVPGPQEEQVVSGSPSGSRVDTRALNCKTLNGAPLTSPNVNPQRFPVSWRVINSGPRQL